MTRAAAPYVAVIGPGETASPEATDLAHEVGTLLAQAGAIVVTGGGQGVMRAAAAGCAAAGGTSVALLPGSDRAAAHPEATVVIPTGLGELRNGLVVRTADVVICVALSWGTLSEVALAVRTGVPVVTLGDLALPLTGPIAAAGAAEAVRLALEAQPMSCGRRSRIRPSSPFTNAGDSSVDNARTSSTASSMTTAPGTSGDQSSS